MTSPRLSLRLPSLIHQMMTLAAPQALKGALDHAHLRRTTGQRQWSMITFSNLFMQNRLLKKKSMFETLSESMCGALKALCCDPKQTMAIYLVNEFRSEQAAPHPAEVLITLFLCSPLFSNQGLRCSPSTVTHLYVRGSAESPLKSS